MSLLLSNNKAGVQFEDKWHQLKPTVNKLLKQQAVTTQEWQDLFWYVPYISFGCCKFTYCNLEATHKQNQIFNKRLFLYITT